MSEANLSARQFRKPPKADPKAKKALLKGLSENFRKQDLKWLKDDSVTVEGPTRVPHDEVEWNDYSTWRAAHQLKAVRKIAKKIDKGKDKPSAFVQRPDRDKKMIMDGHHHALGYVDHKEDPLAYVIHVNKNTGPWDSLHDKQRGDDKKDDFGKTSGMGKGR